MVRIGTLDEPIKHNWSKEDYKEYRRYIVRQAQRRRRLKAREEGICPTCFHNVLTDGRSVCAECSKRIADRAWERRNGMKR